jgi:hypothetical protein
MLQPTNLAHDHSAPPAQYFVLRQPDGWKIKAGYRTTGSFPTKSHALHAAIDLAQKDGMAGRDAQVLLQGEDRTFRTAWIYGRDPYPVLLRTQH